MEKKIIAKLIKGDFDYKINNRKHHCLLGGDRASPSWRKYVSGFKKEFQPHIRAIKKCIKDEKILGEKANHYANYYYFKTSDGHKFSFSWRAWGDLMQAIINKKEGYMAYYM